MTRLGLNGGMDLGDDAGNGFTWGGGLVGPSPRGGGSGGGAALGVGLLGFGSRASSLLSQGTFLHIAAARVSRGGLVLVRQIV